MPRKPFLAQHRDWLGPGDSAGTGPCLIRAIFVLVGNKGELVGISQPVMLLTICW